MSQSVLAHSLQHINLSVSNASISIGPTREVGNDSRTAHRRSDGLHMNDVDKAAFSPLPFHVACGTTIGRNIIDIRRDRTASSLGKMIRNGLCRADGKEKNLPSLLLWDSHGLELFKKITHLPTYYLTREEMEILTQRSQDIAERIGSGTMLVDLGCGDTQKIRPILEALDKMGLTIEYYAMDLSESQLQICIDELSSISYQNILCYGLLGTFDDVKLWLQTPGVSQRSKCLLYLGSSIGNTPQKDAASFLNGFVGAIKQQKTSPISQNKSLESLMIIGVDSCEDQSRVQKAYNDLSKVNASFVLNSLRHANVVLGYNAFNLKDWKVSGEWVDSCYHQYLVPTIEVVFEGSRIKAGERVHIVQSQKYNANERDKLWKQAGLGEICRWSSPDASVDNGFGISVLKIEDRFQRADNETEMFQ